MSVVFITGGTGAIGEAIAKNFSETDDVIFTYCTREEKACFLAEKLHCKAVKTDVTDPKSVSHAVDEVIRKYSRIDILVNNSGISLIKPFLDTSYDEWKRMIDVDLTGVFNVTKAVSRYMVSRKSGAIVNISSIWGVNGASCETAYSAAKAGVIGLTKALAKELGPSGITVNAVAPGVIDSPMNSSSLSPKELSALAEDTPLERLGRPSEVAAAVRALAENRFITGQVLGVDGGFC